MDKTKICSAFAALVFAVSAGGCVDQHPEENSSASENSSGAEYRLAATSPAVADICDKLDLDLAGVCTSSLSTIPERYKNAEKLGSAMSPDTEILASLDLDYILSPSSLESDLQPKYAAIKTKSIFLNLKSVEGMYKSIEELGDMFCRQQQAQKLVDEYTDFMNDYKTKNEGKESPKVLVLMGLPGSYIVATDNSYVGGQEFLNANTEDMETKDPDIIVRCAHALPDEVVDMFNEEFQANDIWKHFRAVEEGRVYDLSYEYFGMSAGFDSPQALEELQPILYGEE